jgi:hypothetical protein
MGKIRRDIESGISEFGKDENVVSGSDDGVVVKNETLQPVVIMYSQDGEQKVFYLHPNEARKAPDAVLASSHFGDLEQARIVKRISI